MKVSPAPSLPMQVRSFDAPVPYAEAVALQERLVAQRLDDTIPDTLLLLEHTPVITLGAAADAKHLLVSADRLARYGIDVVHSARGGDITYHGPGQLVIYPILKLRQHERDVHAYLYRLEETAIRLAARFGVHARRRAGMTGAWTDSGKLAAIGIRVRRWVTFHGLSFNRAPDPDGFQFIVPCGLTGERVTSLRALLAPAVAPSPAVLREACLTVFCEVFHRNQTKGTKS